MLSYFVIIFNIVAGLIYTPWMIERIGKADYGLYVLVTSFLAYFTVDYGLWQAVSKLVAEHHTNGDVAREHHVVNVAASIYLIIDICIAVVLAVLFFFIDDIYTNLSNEESILFKKLYVIATCFALMSFPFIFLRGVFMGREYFVQTKYFDIAKRVGVIAVTVALLLFNLGVTSLVVAFGIVPFTLCIGEYLYLLCKGYRIHPVKIDKITARALLGLSIWLFLVVLGEMFTINIAPSILVRYANTTQVAIFAIGLALYNYVYAFAGAINGFFLPRVLQLRKDNNDSAIVRTSKIASGIQMFVVGLFVMGIVCLGEDFIILWVGEAFDASYEVACLILMPVMITFCQPIEYVELFAADKLKYNAYMQLLSAVMTVTISIVLCPQYGALGAAIGIGVSKLMCMGVGLNIVYSRVLHRSRWPFIIQIVKYVIAFVLTYVIYNFLMELLQPKVGWMTLVLDGLCFCLIYSFITYTIALSSDAKLYIINPMINRIRS